MGSPLSPILAEIYMNNLENNIVENSKHKHNIKLWVRYVDDILIIWTGTDRQLDQFHSEINNINGNITFTIEKGNKTITYLDLTTQIKDNKLHYKIYRKHRLSDTKRLVPPPKTQDGCTKQQLP